MAPRDKRWCRLSERQPAVLTAKFKQDPGTLVATATRVVGRNAEKRLRIEAINVKLELGQAAAAIEHLERVLDQFEAFCTVSMSVREGIAINVQV